MTIQQPEPVSLALGDVCAWVRVNTRRGTPENRTRAAEFAYEWAQARAGQLNPDQLDAQVKACSEYVEMMMAGEAAQGELKESQFLNLFLSVLLPKLALFVARLLLEYLLRNATTLQQWRVLAATPEGTNAGEDIQGSEATA